MKNKAKILIYFLIYGFVFLCLNEIILSLFNFNITIVEKTAIMMVVLLGIGAVTLCIFGTVMQIFYHYKFKANIKIFIGRNFWRRIIMLVIYVASVIYLYGVKAEVGYMILMIAILPLAFNGMFLKGNQYFILQDHKLLYLSENFTIYRIEKVHIDKENSSYILFMTDEFGNMETLVLPESKLIKLEKRNDLVKRFYEC